ncbi:MAG TPA: response regulator, partial [Flavisolibacter sp.]|nr:response regulator [Flavisolibacter sp.]
MPYTKQPLTVLIIEDNEGDLMLFEAYLQQTNLQVATLLHAASLKEAGRFANAAIDITFLDLSLPDSGGVESFIALNRLMPKVPVVVLSGMADESMALQCISLGAQDYLLKDELNEKFLKKSVYYSIERKKNLEEVRTMDKLYELIGSVTDEVVWTWDLDSNEITYAKNHFLGYRDGTIENTLDWWVEKLHPEDRQMIAARIQEVISKKCPSLQFEYRFRSANGSYHYMFSRGVMV